MKKRNQNLLRLLAIAVPMLFLSSCYEIVYVSQDADQLMDKEMNPVICINVYTTTEKAAMPYLGFLLPNGQKVMNGIVYTHELNGYSQVLGKLMYSKSLSVEMEKIDPAPKGYHWWVSAGKAPIDQNGIYRAYPVIKVGQKPGKYIIDYMVGDTESGLNVLRSNNHRYTVVNDRTPYGMGASLKGGGVMLKWQAPSYSQQVMGYYLLEHGEMVNEQLITNTTHLLKNVKSGRHVYSVVPLFKNGKIGEESQPARICYSPCGNSMDFDGVDDKLMVFHDASLAINKTLTLEAWIKFEKENNANSKIISKWHDNQGYELSLTEFKQGQTLLFRLPIGTLQSTTSLFPERWYHVAAVYDGHLMKMYINGQPDCSRLANGYLGTTDVPLVLGKRSDENHDYFYGDIDEVRIWNVARSDKEILDHFNADLTPGETGLVGNWTMSEGCSVFTCDNSQSGNAGYLSGSCFCAEVFPYVEDVSNETNPQLLVPVMFPKKADEKIPPQVVSLKFEMNPKILKFQGIVTENTQLEGYSIKVIPHPSGTITIEAISLSGALKTMDVMVYIDLKPLVAEINSPLKFIECKIDGVNQRVASGDILFTAVPGAFKTSITETQPGDQFIKAYPNPASTTLNVEVGELSFPADLKVTTLSGQEVYRYTLKPEKSNTIHTIDLLGFSKGIYLINLQTENKVHVKKIAVN